MQNVCQQDDNFEIIKCIDCSEYYVYLPRKQSEKFADVTKLCSNDPRVYQACTDENKLVSISFNMISGNDSKYFCNRNFTEEIGVVIPKIFTLSGVYYNATPIMGVYNGS